MCSIEPHTETILYEHGDEFETTGLDKSLRKKYYSIMPYSGNDDFLGVVLNEDEQIFYLVSVHTDKILYLDGKV